MLLSDFVRAFYPNVSKLFFFLFILSIQKQTLTTQLGQTKFPTLEDKWKAALVVD